MNPEDIAITQDPPVPFGMGPGFFNLDNMFAPQNIAIIVAAWGITELISRSGKDSALLRQRLLPMLPLVFCEIFVLLTSNWQPQATWGERVLLGALLGTVTVWGHSVAKKLGILNLLPFMKEPSDDEAQAAPVVDVASAHTPDADKTPPV